MKSRLFKHATAFVLAGSIASPSAVAFSAALVRAGAPTVGDDLPEEPAAMSLGSGAMAHPLTGTVESNPDDPENEVVRSGGIIEEASAMEPESQATSSGLTRMAPGFTLASQVQIPLVFELRPDVTIDQERMTIGDLGRCQGYARACNEIMGLEFGRAPGPGKVVTVSGAKIKQAVAVEFPQISVTIKGSELVHVKGAYIDVLSEEVQEALKNQLDEAAKKVGNVRYVLSYARMLVPVKVRPGQGRFVFPKLATEAAQQWQYLAKQLSGSVLLEVERMPIGTERTEPQVFKIACGIAIERQLPVPVRSIAAGSRLERVDFELNWVRINSQNAGYVESLSQLDGMAAKRGMMAGQAIAIDSVAKPLLVKQGQVVTILVNSSGVSITGKVQVLKSASEGQLVDVVYPDTKRRLSARVIDENTVEAAF